MAKEYSYAIDRSKAIAATENALQKVVFAAAKQIVSLSSKYRRGKKLSAEKTFLQEAQSIATGLTDRVENVIGQYALAATKRLNVDEGSVSAFLSEQYFGATSRQRTSSYLANFAEDIVRMAKAGILMGYDEQKILAAVRTGYKNPYLSSVITKARKADVNIASPSYGKGIFKAAYHNIIRNAQQMVSVAWGIAEQAYGKEHGAVAFRVFRGSSYPCAICDDETVYVHHFGDPYPPFHVNCRCFIKFLYDNKDSEPHNIL